MLPTTPPPTEPPMPTTSDTTVTPAPPAITDVSITSPGIGTVGESYSLECTVTVTGSTDQPTITWLDPAMNNMITSGVVTTGSMSTLTFNQLASSQASGAAVASGESEVSVEYEGPDRTVRTG